MNQRGQQQQQPFVVRGEVRLLHLESDVFYVELAVPPADKPMRVRIHGVKLPLDGEEQEVTQWGSTFLMYPNEVITVQAGEALGVYQLRDGKLWQLARHGIEVKGIAVAGGDSPIYLR